MKIYGYCWRCKRFRPVTLTSSSLALRARGNVVIGECDDCREEDG